MSDVALPIGPGTGVSEVLWFAAARWVLILALLAAPLALGAVQPWAWGTLEAVAFVVFLLWLIGTVVQKEAAVLWSPLYVPGLLLLLLGALQLSFRLTLDWTSTREAFLKLSLGLVLFFLATQLLAAGSQRVVHRFGLVVCAFAFLLSMFALVQLFSSHDKIYWTIPTPHAVFGPYVNRNHYAGLMEMLIPVAAAYAATRRVGLSLRLLLGFLVLIPVVSVFISGSRGGLLSLCCEILIAAGIAWQLVPKGSRRSLLAVAAAGVVITVSLAFWLINTEASQRIVEALNLKSAANEPAAGTRIRVSRDSLRILKEHPWIGTGMGSFEVAFPAYQSFPSDLLWDHAHNDYVEALAENGFVGGAMMLGGLVLFLRLAFSNLRVRLKSRAGWISCGAAVGCCGILVHSLVDFNLHLPANAAWFAASMAIACASSAAVQGGLGQQIPGANLD